MPKIISRHYQGFGFWTVCGLPIGWPSIHIVARFWKDVTCKRCLKKEK